MVDAIGMYTDLAFFENEKGTASTQNIKIE